MGPARSTGAGLPVVAIVGRPNVGKSSLVNRILGKREAIVEETPGVTRDRRSFVAEWTGRRFEVMDTGGLEPGAQGLDARVAEQAQVAIASADLIVLVVDASSGILQDDLLVAETLRRAEKPVLVVVNKVDDAREEASAAEFYRLGLGDPVMVSALHGRGSGDLLDTLVAALPESTSVEETAWGALAIVGRPNVGKSSLLNAILGSARSIVDARPGTTRDPVDSLLQLDSGEVLRIVDTAGMRREVQIKDPIEYFGFLRSRSTLSRVDAALLVVDVSEGVTSHDQRIAEEIVEHGRACVVVLNKWDLVGGDEADLRRLERDIDTRLRFLPWAPMIRTSAITGRGVNKLLPAATAAIAAHRTRLTTSVVNDVLKDAQERSPHPRSHSRAVRVLYAVQASVGPPRFLLFSNSRLETGYTRYLEKQLRAAGSFEGSPVQVEVKVRTRSKVDG